MASQMAQIISQYGANMPTGGLERGVRGFYEMKEMGERSIERKSKLDAEKKAKLQEALFGPVMASNTNEKWLAAQNSGFIPKEMSFEQREPFLMGVLGEKAMETVEVGDPKSQTGTRHVLAFDVAGKPGKPTGATGKIGTYNPRDYTVESFSNFAKSGDPSVLERYTEKTIDIGGVPHKLVPGSTNQYEPIKSASQVATDKAGIEAAVATARQNATQDVQKKITELGAGKNLDQAIGVYETLKAGDLDRIYGFGEKIYPDWLRSEEGVTLQANRDRLIAMLQLAGRGQLKGQGTITDAEQATVANAATILSNPNISPDAAYKALDEAMGILYRNAGKEFAPSAQPVPPAAPAQQLPPTNAQGWNLMIDAQGNKAYVGPNGEIQVVQ